MEILQSPSSIDYESLLNWALQSNENISTVLIKDPEAVPLDWNSTLLILYQLHNEFKKYKDEIENDCNIPDFVYSIADNYKKVHGYLALFVCIFGAIANTFIVVVLTRKEMRTPINLMLFTLAIADLLIMIEYIPFALHMYFGDQSPELKYSFTWAWFVFFHLHFTQILHVCSIQLTLTMAIWRYVAIKYTNKNSNPCTFKSCYKAIFGACICPLFLCILNYFYFHIVKKTKYITYGPPPFNTIDEEDQEKLEIFKNACLFLNLHDCSFKKVDVYVVEMSELVKDHPILHTIHFWIFSVIIKLIPCIVLTFVMCWLILTLYQTRTHHKELKLKPGLYPLAIYSAIEEGCPPAFCGNEEEVNLDEITSTSPTSNKFNLNEDNVVRENSENNAKTKPTIDIENNILPVTESPPDIKAKIIIPIIAIVTQRFIKVAFFRQHLKSNKLINQPTCHRTDRTSKILIAILLLFLLTEFPQGIMHFLTGWYGIDFLKCNYNPLAEIFDILALINAAVNFILYCFMSQQFRTQFRICFTFTFCSRKAVPC